MEGVINKLFEGRILKFIECLNVDYKSTKRDDYMDIFLDVKGCKNVYESFDRLTAEERLEGDNQYNAEGHGMQVCGSCVRVDAGTHGILEATMYKVAWCRSCVPVVLFRTLRLATCSATSRPCCSCT